MFMMKQCMERNLKTCLLTGDAHVARLQSQDLLKYQIRKVEKDMAVWRCIVCGYEYDEDAEGKPFADLPDDWECPMCGAPKSEFEKA